VLGFAPQTAAPSMRLCPLTTGPPSPHFFQKKRGSTVPCVMWCNLREMAWEMGSRMEKTAKRKAARQRGGKHDGQLR
jgi:hypothetical protein